MKGIKIYTNIIIPSIFDKQLKGNLLIINDVLKVQSIGKYPILQNKKLNITNLKLLLINFYYYI